MTKTDSKKWWIFLGGSLMVFLVNVDTTIVNLALATIAKDLNTSLTQIQWIINSYLLTTVIFFIIGGKWSDIIGKKKVFLLGTAIFTLASLIAGFAPNFAVLIVARLIQGIGFAFTLSLAFLMISSVFPENQRGCILGVSITISGLGQALGPTLGGIMLEFLNWHWIFLINVPIAVLSFVVIFLAAQQKERIKEDQTIDYFGVVLFGAALTVMLLTFNELTGHDFNLKLFIGGLAVSVVIFLGFFYKEIRTRFPLIDFKLFARRDYTLSISLRFLFMYLYGTFLFFIPLFLQNILGYTPLLSGLMLLVYSALFAVFSPIAGIWCDQAGYKVPIVFAAFVCMLAFITLALIQIQMSLYTVLFGMACFGLSTGILFPSTVNSTVSSLPKTSAGEGLGMFFTVAFLGASLGVAISGAQLNLVSMHNLINAQQPLINALNSSQFVILHRVAIGAQPMDALRAIVGAGDYQMLSQLAKQSFIKGFSSVMWLNAFFAVIITILGFCLQKRQRK